MKGEQQQPPPSVSGKESTESGQRIKPVQAAKDVKDLRQKTEDRLLKKFSSTDPSPKKAQPKSRSKKKAGSSSRLRRAVGVLPFTQNKKIGYSIKPSQVTDKVTGWLDEDKPDELHYAKENRTWVHKGKYTEGLELGLKRPLTDEFCEDVDSNMHATVEQLVRYRLDTFHMAYLQRSYAYEYGLTPEDSKQLTGLVPKDINTKLPDALTATAGEITIPYNTVETGHT